MTQSSMSEYSCTVEHIIEILNRIQIELNRHSFVKLFFLFHASETLNINQRKQNETVPI